ncbi:conserved hypothetical protein [Leptospira interrogans serovar Manilae]|uniref:Uncharacterized protein n=1 Tax=Leptospira interrogans serovar Manilae TaxID=214675 RepID=A0AAQ1P3A3_LEPIR|nr:conserved hypothetical protein [Leptospira interrogans serovar Manilae]
MLDHNTNYMTQMWELLQTLTLRINSQNVGTITNTDFTNKFSKYGNYHKH